MAGKTTPRLRAVSGRAILTLAIALGLLPMLVQAGPAQAGNMVSASCPCGYKAENLLLFGGRANFQTFCAFPVHCQGCPDLTVLNLYADKLTCPKCPGSKAVPYDDPSLIGRRGKVITGWNTTERLGRALELTDGEYLCPACGKFSLKFQVTGFWD